MLRTIQIFINDQYYKDMTITVNDDGAYSLGSIMSLLNQDKEAGLFEPFGSAPHSIRVQLHL